MVASTSRIKLILCAVLATCVVGATIGVAVYYGTGNSGTGETQETTTATTPCPTHTTVTVTPEVPPTESLLKHLHGRPRPGLRGALVDYVYGGEIADSVYDWKIYNQERVPETSVTTYFLNLTSQIWMDENFSNHPLWFHHLVVHIPDTVIHPEAGFVFVTGGRNNGGDTTISDSEVQALLQYTMGTGIPTGVLRQIPNQPVIFENDGQPRTEDDLIAWTWQKYYNDTYTESQNPDVLARWPMVKGTIKAMDAMAELAHQEKNINITKFMVGGGSKRGWTAWMVGAVERRVVAMLPIVLSCLNMAENFAHYWTSFGGWPFVMNDYWSKGLMGLLLNNPRFGEVIFHVDPYQYRQFMNVPKLIISASSDEFFLLDDSHYYFDSLPGEKHLWILENAGHGINNPAILQEVWSHTQSFFLSVLQDRKRPNVQWTRESNATGGLITVTCDVTPSKLMAWSAPSNPPLEGGDYRRDWRRAGLNPSTGIPQETGITWTEKEVDDKGGNKYEVYYDQPGVGFLAFFIKLYFPAFDGREYIYSTEAQIIPDTFPFPPCEGQTCQGLLV